jgi:uncharacterized Tic20 family protein
MAQTDEIPQGGGQTNYAGAPPATGLQEREPNKDARMWAMLCHLAGLLSVLGPLIVWLIKKDEYPFVDEQGKEAVNFQLTMLIYLAAVGVLCFLCIGFLLMPLVGLVDLILFILAAIKANDGYHYRYPKPFIMRLVK